MTTEAGVEVMRLQPWTPRSTGNHRKLELAEGSPPPVFGGSAALPTPCFWSSSFHNYEAIHSVVLSHLVCGDMLRLPQEMNVPSQEEVAPPVSLEGSHPNPVPHPGSLGTQDSTHKALLQSLTWDATENRLGAWSPHLVHSHPHMALTSYT